MTTIRTSLLFAALRGEHDLDEAITAIIEDCYVPDVKAHSNRVEAIFDSVCGRFGVATKPPGLVRLDLSERADRIWAANHAAHESKA